MSDSNPYEPDWSEPPGDSKIWNALMWMYRRMKPTYGRLPFVEEAIVMAAAPPPPPKLIFALPDYEVRRIEIASDEVIDGERVVRVAIKDAKPSEAEPSEAEPSEAQAPDIEQESKEAQPFLPIEWESRSHVETACAAFHLSRRPQTLRQWACLENGPIRPTRVNGRLAWAVADIKRLLNNE